jgi:hypothetical protein
MQRLEPIEQLTAALSEPPGLAHPDSPDELDVQRLLAWYYGTAPGSACQRRLAAEGR